MGIQKQLSEKRNEVRRFNTARRRAEKLASTPSSGFISMETISEVEKFTLSQSPERITQFNKEVEQWQERVSMQLRATIASRSLTVARELKPKTYKDKYGVINRIGFSFPRHGIYIHKGAGNGQGGYIGSKWKYHKMINGIYVNTSITRHTDPASLGKQDQGNRKAFQWFDPVIKNRISELADIVSGYFDTMIIDATKIYIEK